MEVIDSFGNGSLMSPKKQRYEHFTKATMYGSPRTFEAYNPKVTPSLHVNVLGLDLRHLPFGLQFLVCVLGIFGFFIPYGYIQESLYRVEGFRYGLFVSFVQYIFYTIFAFSERKITKDVETRASIYEYARTSIFLVTSLCLSNVALIYVNYPIKVLFKSSKLIPVMILGRFMFGKRYNMAQYLATTFLFCGVVMFSLADANTSPNFSQKGILFMCLSITAESLGQNFQEQVIAKNSCTEREVLFYQSVFGTFLVFLLVVASGELVPAFSYAYENPCIFIYIFMLAVLGYLGAMFSLAITRTCGIFITLTVTTCRKLLTIVFSFVFFPKPFVITYLIAGLLALCGIILNVYAKNQKEMTKFFRDKFKGSTGTKSNVI